MLLARLISKIIAAFSSKKYAETAPMNPILIKPMDPVRREKINHWIAIAKQLEQQEEAIECPFCQAEKLTILPVLYPDGVKKDVYVNCPACEANMVFSGVSFNVRFQ